MVLGAMFVSEDVHAIIEGHFRAIRGNKLARATMKWEKVSDLYYREYRDSALLIARHGYMGRFEYHSMILDTSKFDHDTYNEGDEELGYYKFFFNLLKWRMRHEGCEYFVTMDRRTNRQKDRLMKLRSYLNDHLFTWWWYEPVREIVPRSCKDVLFLQLTDILTGAVAFHANDRDTVPGARAAKVRLAQEIARGVGLPRLSIPTSPYRFYSNWVFRLDEPQRGQRRTS